jgi:hypothetical protein
MFEEICLVCGRQVDDGYFSLSTTLYHYLRFVSLHRRAYCSDSCQSMDTSPSISSASSTFSSPHLGYAVGGDVPALIPSALGAALNNYRHDPYSVSSSSASSTSWSLLTDQEEDDFHLNVESDSHDQDSGYEPSTKSVHIHPVLPSGLSYARRPSGTNNRSTVPLLHRRTSSSSDTAHVHGVPRSAPIHLLTSAVPFLAQDDESYSSDISIPSDRPRRPDNNRTKQKDSTITTTKAKRHRNRASLPAYFSLLQMSGSSNSTPRLSPPTPKSSLAVHLPKPPVPAQVIPRGRLREAGTSRASRRTRSRSRSPSRPKIDGDQAADDCSSAPVLRGRTARRNSSPPQRMVLSGTTGPDPRIVARGRPESGEPAVGRSRLTHREAVGGRSRQMI